MDDKNIVLSICISSYNKGDRCCRLVRDILSIDDDRYNIFICDDWSDNITMEKLNSIRNPKVNVVRNQQNLGACKNWYNTINCGNGMYILHVLDRDDIEVKYLKVILDILEQNTIGGGYIGKSTMRLEYAQKGKGLYHICIKGKEAFLTMAGVPIHPTGFLVNRNEWKKGRFKRYFYLDEKYGIYPHSYVLGEISVYSDMLYMPIVFLNYRYHAENKKSRFYIQNKNQNYYWLPDSVIKVANQLILVLYKLADKTYIEDFLVYRFRQQMHRATIDYAHTVNSLSEMTHYGLSTRNVSKVELCWITLKDMLMYEHMLNKIELNSLDLRKRLVKVWIDNLRKIAK
jgi:hypothetical protein